MMSGLRAETQTWANTTMDWTAFFLVFNPFFLCLYDYCLTNLPEAMTLPEAVIR